MEVHLYDEYSGDEYVWKNVCEMHVEMIRKLLGKPDLEDVFVF